MRIKSWAGAQFLTSPTIVAAIVASVVLVNSVAWGIPLLVGGKSQSNGQLDSSRFTTGAVPKQENKGERRATGSKQAFRLAVPLPSKAPGSSELAAVAPSGKPSTLFPRPAAWQEQRAKQRVAPTVHESPGTKQQVRSSASNSSREVVLVSPYTPGVRVSPNGVRHEWRHRNLSESKRQATLASARAIARRATRRFEQMRDRMAKLDVRAARGLSGGLATQRALLPVAPRPPRFAGRSNLGRGVSLNTGSFVRARLVRRPTNVGDVQHQTPRTRSSLDLREATQSNVGTRFIPSPSNRALNSQQIARLTPTVRRSANRYPRPSVRKRRKARRNYRRRARIVRRKARRRISRRRYRPRRINGFRRGFHRQLVAANFFGNNN